MFEIWVRLSYHTEPYCFKCTEGIKNAQWVWDTLNKAGFVMMSARP